MTLALAETSSRQTDPRLRPSRFHEWNIVEFLTMLCKEHQSLQEDWLELFQSDVATSTGVSKMSAPAAFSLVYGKIKTEAAMENDTRVHEDPEEELARFQQSLPNSSITTLGSEEILDWDAHIEMPPPPRQSGTIKVRFKYMGRSKPIPIDDPWA